MRHYLSNKPYWPWLLNMTEFINFVRDVQLAEQGEAFLQAHLRMAVRLSRTVNHQ
jgi:hypothetical protein